MSSFQRHTTKREMCGRSSLNHATVGHTKVEKGCWQRSTRHWVLTWIASYNLFFIKNLTSVVQIRLYVDFHVLNQVQHDQYMSSHYFASISALLTESVHHHNSRLDSTFDSDGKYNIFLEKSDRCRPPYVFSVACWNKWMDPQNDRGISSAGPITSANESSMSPTGYSLCIKKITLDFS